METWAQLDMKNAVEDPMDTREKKLVEDTIQKWLLLQKTVKEEITLEEIILKQQQDDFNKLRTYYKDFYELKVKSRKAYEDIKNLKLTGDNTKAEEVEEYYIEEKIENVLFQLVQPITNLLFIFRNNSEYIIKLISLIDESQDEPEQIESLVELFCNQFYDNILIPNPEQEELLILIYKLFEREIGSMNTASIDEFMHDSTFLGKFISSFIKKQELNNFLSILLNPMITSIENKSVDDCLNMSLFAIQKFIRKDIYKENINIKDAKINEEKFLFENLPKTNIHFKKNLQIEAEKAEENRKKIFSLDTEEGIGEKNGKNIEGKNQEKILGDNQKKIFEEKNRINNEYTEYLTQDKLIKKFEENKDNIELRDFYEYQLEQINDDQDVFSNKGLIEVLNDECFMEEKNEIAMKYIKNFIYIKENVDNIIQALIDKLTSIPYTIRCICKIISILINKKFPLLPKYLQNSFIGKFIFNKWIFPVLSLENKCVVENIIYNSNTQKCLNVIISVLSSANKCMLFNSSIDTEKTIFNYYLIEIIPILNKFYEKLIDIELPKTLSEIISQNKDIDFDNFFENDFFSFNDEENVNNKEQNNNNNNSNINVYNIPSYDYFTENSDEIMKIECICFSISDILYIMSLINKDLNKFKSLPKYDSFSKAVRIIRSDEYKLDKQLEIENEMNKRRFFVIYKDEKNSKFQNLFTQSNKKKHEQNLSKNDEICFKIKDCIKNILKNLNMLNNKDYSYLNMATSNEKFLKAIQYTLEDIGEFTENENNQIPLNWYGQFIETNKQNLPESYFDNDLEKLYEELINEEMNTLNELKSFSSIIITRDGMNLRCAEKILEKIKYENKKIEQAKKFQKIENFIEKDKTRVCLKIRDGKEKEKPSGGGLKSFFGKKEKEKDNKNEQFISVLDADKCPHSDGDKNKKISSHANNINEFINKFCNLKYPELVTLNNYIKEDFKTGNPTHQIYKAIDEYIELLKENIIKNDKLINIKNKTKEEIDNELMNFTDKIEEYIMRKMYKYVYREDALDLDKIFHKKTKELNWIVPEQFDIKKLYINQLRFAIANIRKMEQAKSVFEKIKCIENAFTNINNSIKFSTGKNSTPGQEEVTPILHFTIIKAQPMRFISQLNYIKCFRDLSKGGKTAFMVTQLDGAATFILNIDYTNLKMSKEDFDKNVKEAKRKI
jgi:hypothetical protein